MGIDLCVDREGEVKVVRVGGIATGTNVDETILMIREASDE